MEFVLNHGLYKTDILCIDWELQHFQGNSFTNYPACSGHRSNMEDKSVPEQLRVRGGGEEG